ncbi:MAG TPA: GNAT family N-acetyltransferase [Bryobacteraceae bacterium]|jgi:GNAT superfamily N-acetyltransferase|nr:GNAT family N-acetyltransferase [Bryobacteraceae bacterium]
MNAGESESDFHIEKRVDPSPQELDRLRSALSTFNRSKIPDRGYLPVHFELLDEGNEFAGGVSGYVSYGWLFIDTLWVSEPARIKGWGRRLMLAAEDEARQNGCRRAWLDTFSFQARAFYEKIGYRVFAELEEFPSGHSRYFLRKEL